MSYTHINQIRELYKKYFYVTPEVEVLIDAIIAITVAVKLPGDAIWLMIVGPSSSGKTELVNILMDIKFAHQVSTLTENTLLSSMRSSNGKENSLLHRIGPRGLLVMKDYTSIISMSDVKRDPILAQLREVFDGYFKKESGNGFSQEWIGKICALFCVTDAIYQKGGESAAMGRRSMVYEIPNLTDDRKLDMGRAAIKIGKNINEIRDELKAAVAEFVEYKVKEISNNMPVLSEEMVEELLQISLFVTKARAGVARDWKGTLVDINDSEGVTRFNTQITKTIETMLYISDKEKVDEEYVNFAFKLGLDSIPRQRRIALTILAEYRSATARSVALKAGMPTETLKQALEELTAHKLVERKSNPKGVGSDHWFLKDKWKYMMIKYAKLSTLKMNETLDYDDEDTDVEMSASMKNMMGITDDEVYNKELDEAGQRKQLKEISALKKIGLIGDIQEQIKRKTYDLESLDYTFYREQSEAKAKALTREIEELNAKLKLLESPQEEQVQIQEEILLPEF